ncbi:MAG: eukaryotic-like serine/threonine-protein kinase [Gemmatimonadales bacterium]|nr:eukaryotic-like serine/threonine-protein kinase [Gemmatimonadales bacterium]
MATNLTCLACGGDLSPDNRFCSHCGAGVHSCAACGRPLLDSEGFCPSCGTPADPTAVLDSTDSQEPDSTSGWGEVVQRLRRATLGEFEIGPELGRGAMAAVFLAHESSLDRKVAIKVMSPGLLMDEGMAERFKREAITIANLNHPNIVSVHSVRQAEGLHFFVMRYIRGRSLEDVMQQAGRLPLPVVRSILSQVGSALSYAHRSRVVHRDIKPANILIDEDGNAVVTDFGIAKVAELPSATNPGALVGTPAYMSPEQCSGAEVSGASDQYALGAVAYEMITGVSPFIGSTLTVMRAHLEQPPQPIRDLNGECPPELEAAVLRMLEKDPEARWPSIAQAKTALGATPLEEENPLLAELCRLATPDPASSILGRPTSTTPRTRVSSARSVTPAGLVRSVSILPPPAALETGDSFMLVALLRGERGAPLPGRPVQWATDAPEVLRVDGSRGEATAVAPGSARLTATCEGVRARLQVHIAPPLADDEADVQADAGVVTVQVSAPPKSVKAGDSFVLTATPLDYRGGFILGRTVQWSTSDVGVAIVTASGWVATLGPGSVVLQASCEGATASVSINVEQAAPAPKRARPPLAKPREVSSAPEERRPVRRRRTSRGRRRWILAGSVGVLVLTPVLWLYGGLRDVALNSARQSGTVPVAEGEAFQASTTEPVAAILRGAPASVTIERSRRMLLPGASTRFVAEVRDLAGRTVPASSVTWSSTDSAVVRVDSASGLVHAVGPGRARVVAASGAMRASTAIVVRPTTEVPPAAASVSIAPHDSLLVGDTVTLAAAALDEKGAPLAAADIFWSSSEPGIAAVEARTGRVRGYGPGTATIIATSGSIAARSELTVLPADVSPDTLLVQAYESGSWEPEEPKEPAPGPAVTVPEDAGILTGVQQCYDALRFKNVDRVAELYRPADKSDREKLSKLTRILRTEEWSAVVGERVDGTRQLGNGAAAEFSFQLAWKDAFGGRLTSRPVFRAEFARSGNRWQMLSCRIVGSPKL